MLVLLSNTSAAEPEEVELDFVYETNSAAQGYQSVWFGHPLRCRAVLRDGTQVAMAMTLPECARAYLVMREDPRLQGWVEMLDSIGPESSSFAS